MLSDSGLRRHDGGTGFRLAPERRGDWNPACAGMTGGLDSGLRRHDGGTGFRLAPERRGDCRCICEHPGLFPCIYMPDNKLWFQVIVIVVNRQLVNKAYIFSANINSIRIRVE